MIFEWAVEFSFRIDGDYILIEKVDTSGFNAKFDEQFKMWENKGRAKKGISI